VSWWAAGIFAMLNGLITIPGVMPRDELVQMWIMVGIMVLLGIVEWILEKL
jgi:hypothetical protein